MIAHTENIELRKIWKNETADFNKWLFEEKNLSLLSKEIGIPLKPFKKEMKVAKGRVDILAIDKENDTYVLIENQIAEADHHHLAKILDYINSVKPETTVWIVSNWKNFHANTIKILKDQTNFFVVKVEVLKIKNSLPGVKFTTIIEPEDWNQKRRKYAYSKIKNPENDKKIGLPNYTVEFFYWIESRNEKSELINIKLYTWIKKKEIFSNWAQHCKSITIQLFTPHMFTKMMKEYCRNNQINFITKKSGGVELYYFEPLIKNK
jgi:hypothetical protein